MSIKNKLRKIMQIGAIGIALLIAPIMSPSEIENLLCQVSVPKVAQKLRQQGDYGDVPPERADLEDE